MSTDKRPWLQCQRIADGLIDRLSPACNRIEAAGSLRRHCAAVGDIELVAVPVLQLDLFGQPTGRSMVDDLLAEWPVQILKNGDRYKQFVLTTSTGNDYQIDLFLQPDPATWGVNFLIRTGCAEFSKRMVAPTRLGGLMPDRYHVRDARVWDGTAAIDTPEESDVFAAWGMEYIPPEKRVR